MALAPKTGADPTTRLVALALASGLPLACYLATASAQGYWFDAGEFVAASIDLDITHPPGHPLAALVGHAATLIPLGPLALRVALASAVFAAIAAGFLFSAIEKTVRSLGIARSRVAVPLALGATWLVAGSYGWWFQAVRPEVYALEAALACIALERTIALEAAWPTRDVRPAYVASLALGLALANHHFLAFLLLPAMAPTMARVRRVNGNRALLVSAGCVLAGLATYAYLPARASIGPPLNLGQPDSPARLYWVVSAQAFQGNTGSAVPQPAWERVADVAVQLVDNLHPVPVLMALAGIYVILRTPGARRIGYVWVSVLVVFFAARAWLGFVRSNPDALGYLMPAFGAVGALAAAFVAAILTLLGRGDGRRPRKTAVAIAMVLALLGLAQVHANVERASLGHFFATDAFEDPARRDLPPRAVVLVHNPQTLFRLWGGEASERLRPDVTFVPMPLLAYPGMVNALVERDPDLSPLLRGYLLEGELGTADLQSLAALRPLLVELDPRVPPALHRTIVPRGLFSAVLSDDAYDEDRVAGAQAHRLEIELLYKALGLERDETETAHQLLWHHYMSALYYASTGDRISARRFVRLGRALNPHAAELAALDRALAPTAGADGEVAGGPLDVSPFLPVAAP